MLTNTISLGLAGAFLLACSSSARGPANTKQVTKVPDKDVLITDDGFELRYDREHGRFSSLSIPGLRADLTGPAEAMGVTVYDHESRVLVDSAAAPAHDVRFEAEPGEGQHLRLVRDSADSALRVEETWIARSNHIELQATIIDTGVESGAAPSAERAIEACVIVPFDAVGKTWHHHLHQAEVIEPNRLYRSLLTESLDIGHWSPAGEGAHFKSDLDFNLHGLNLIGDDTSGLAVAMHPDAPASYYVEYDSSSQRLSACFHLGIYGAHKTRPDRTALRLLLFHPDEPRWGLRGALEKYAAVYPAGFRGHLPRQIGMTVGGAYNFAYHPDPSRFHISAMWNGFSAKNRAIGVDNLLYAWPTGFIDRGMRLGLQALQAPCSACDTTVNAHIRACMDIYRDYEAGRLRFPTLCRDAWSRTGCQENPVAPRQSQEYGPVYWQKAFYILRPLMVGEPSNLALRLFGKFAVHEPMAASILRDPEGSYAGALSSPRAIAAVDKDTYTCFINGINPDPGVEYVAAARPTTEPPVATENFGQLNLEVVRRGTGVYGPRYIYSDARNGPMVFDGVAVDTVGAYLRPDFHASMLAVATLPLGYEHATGKVAAMEHLTLTAFMRALRRAMPKDAALAMNGYPISGTLGQDVDHFVRELGRRWRKGPRDDRPRFYNELYDEDLATRLRRIYRQRMVAYQRPITFWARFTHTEKRAAKRGITPQAMLLADMERYLPLYTAQGIYIYIQRTGIGKRDIFFMQPQPPEVLATYERHLDIVDALTRAGWEPVSHITTSAADIVTERFGATLFTLYNSADSARTFAATIEWKKLGMPAGGLRVRDFESGQRVAVTIRGDVAVVNNLELAGNSVKILVVEQAGK